jgi:uncharacterized protein YdcH (DUF465 family)
MSRWAQTFSGFKAGGTPHLDRLLDKLRENKHHVARIDENIDIAQRTAQMASSPAGEELSAEEIARQVVLQKKLLDSLRKELSVSKTGARLSDHTLHQFKRGHDPKVDEWMRHLNNLRDQRARITHMQRGRKNPDMEATNHVDREIEDVKKKIDDRQSQLKNSLSRVKTLRSTFRDALRDMQGLTGHGGRIFDTKLELDDLRNTTAGGLGATGMSIDQLIAFSHALQSGAFRTQGFTAFHTGGIVRPPRAGQQEMTALLEKGEGVVSKQDVSDLSSKPATRNIFNVLVKVGDREIKDITVEVMEAKDRKTTAAYKRGKHQ